MSNCAKRIQGVDCALLVASIAVCGCGSSVTIESAPAPPEEEESGVTPPEPPLPEPACGESTARITVELAGCTYDDHWDGEIDRVDALPSGDGVAIHAVRCMTEACDCTIEVRGIDTSFADAFGKPHRAVAVSGLVRPDAIRLAKETICAACYPCPCVQPLPLLHAADGPLPAEVGAQPTLTVEQGAEECRDSHDGCDSAAYRVRARTFFVDGYTPTFETASLELAEGESAALGDTGLTFTVLRASGRSRGCAGASPALAIGNAAWFVAPRR